MTTKDSGVRFNGEVSLGHLLLIGTFIAGAIYALSDLKLADAAMAARVNQVENDARTTAQILEGLTRIHDTTNPGWRFYPPEAPGGD